PGDTAATKPELLGDEDTAAHTQIVETRTSLHVRRVRLSVQTGPAAGREFAADKERIRIGNARVPPGHDGSGNDLALDDKKVSRFHCEISFTDKGWLLTDLDSTRCSRTQASKPSSIPREARPETLFSPSSIT